MRSAEPRLRVGDLLDRQFAFLRGEMERSKTPSLAALGPKRASRLRDTERSQLAPKE
jgi:hypothetical protein